MELVVRKNDLLRELQLFQGIVERKNTIPILANVLMEAKGDQVSFLATDLEVGLRSRCSAAVAKGGSLTLPAKKFYEIVKSLPETEIRIAEDKGGVKVAADRFDSRMQTLPREDFPTLPDAGATPTATVPRAALKEMVAKTQFAITGEDTRYFLNGALFVLRPDSMTLVATDGHRLALVTTVRAGGSADNGEVKAILPRKTLGELARLLSEGDEDIRYERGENHLFFDVGGRLLISRMIDGQFPAYERVIPKGNDKHIDFERDRLTNAVKRVALLSNERSRAVKFQIDKNRVEVTSSSPDLGEAKETLPVEYSGASMQICFNAQYVLDFLSVVSTDTVSLDLKDEVSQAVMRPVGAEGYDYTYVIMPMRV
ncbi:MAG TPA: DNA polymerase III subunit beta [Vicinamibacterales bacterium]|nr:DNA polymerase III subunit beta [Vicinamibacterales bacterium]